MPERRSIDVCLLILVETDKAYKTCIEATDKETYWLPKSQVKLDQDGGVGDTCIFTLPEWLAIEKGLA